MSFHDGGEQPARSQGVNRTRVDPGRCDPVHNRIEQSQLPVGRRGALGCCEMGPHPGERGRRGVRDRCGRGEGILGAHASPGHPGLDLQMHPKGRVVGSQVIGDVSCLTRAPNGHVDGEAGHLRGHPRRHRVEDEDAARVAITTEAACFGGIGDAKPFGPAGDRTPTCHLEPMAITVGLHHRTQCCGLRQRSQCHGIGGEHVDVYLDPHRAFQSRVDLPAPAHDRCGGSTQRSVSDSGIQASRALRMMSAVEPMPVHRSNATSPWRTSISSPLHTASPRAAAARTSGVSGGT